MYKKHSIFVGILLLFILAVSPAFAQLPQISTGLSYLTSSQNPDGSWDTTASQVETTASSISVLETLKLLNQTAGSSYATGISWLQAQSPQDVEYIAERIRALNLTDGSPLFPARDTLGGAWGGYTGYETNILDTALALQALQAANFPDSTIINPALIYLTTSQNPDGGWGFYKDDASNVYMTAVVSATLQQFPQMTTIATAINKATAYLTAHQNIDGGFGSSPSTVYETALAYSALVAVSTDSTVLGGALNYLSGTQSANGSWNDDPYSTALALKALFLSENKPLPPPLPPAGGRITGTVLDSSTNQRLSGVTVVLESNPLINTFSDAFGNFSLTDVPAGAQAVDFSLSGYASYKTSVDVVEGAVASLGTIPLISHNTAGTIMGIIFDSAGHPLSDVAISVTGAWDGSAVTGADGTFTFTSVPPGEVTISATKTGYQQFTAAGTVFARTTLSVFPRMNTVPSQATTGSIVGRVVSNWSGLPIDHLPGEQGVTVTVSGGITVEPDPDTGGNFSIQGLTPNTYQVTVGMNGYISQTFRLPITAGVTTDLGTIRLVMSIETMTLTGQVTDSVTGVPIPGAEVVIVGPNLTGRSDFAGTYVIADIKDPEFTVRASASGYERKSMQIYQPGGRAALWTQRMDITLTPVTSSRISGVVRDAATGTPIAGAQVSIPGGDKAATTGSDGSYSITGVTQMVLSLKASALGYDSKLESLMLNAFGEYEVPFALSRSSTSSFAIKSLATDKTSYNTNEPVTVTAEIENAGDVAAELTVEAEIVDQDGNVLRLLEPPGNPVAFDSHAVQTVSLQWNTGQAGPGDYAVRLKALAPAGTASFNPFGNVLAEKSTQLSIQATIDLAAPIVTMRPGFVYVGSTETVNVGLSVIHQSNIPATVAVEFSVESPSGTSLASGNIPLSLSVSSPSMTVPLATLANTFAQAGQYPVRAVISKDGVVLKETAAVFVVLPNIRIEPTKTVTPQVLLPDGTGKVRITIELKGVEKQ